MKDLVIIKELDALVVFSKGGAKSLVDRVRDEVMDEVYDLSTIKGRKRIASRAFDVSKSKTALDNFGKDLADQLNAKLKPINVERKYARDELDKLRNEVRQPLTDWEDEQKEIEAAKLAEKEAADLLVVIADCEELASLINENFDRDAKAELERIEQERIAYEADLQAKAALEATRLAEEKAEAQRKQVEEDKQTAIRNEQRAILQAEAAAQREKQLIIDAELAANQKVIDAKNSEDRRLAAIELAKQQQIEKQQKEQARLAAEQKARDDDKSHRASVNNCAVSALMEFANLTEEQAKAVVVSLVKGQIPKAKLTY